MSWKITKEEAAAFAKLEQEVQAQSQESEQDRKQRILRAIQQFMEETSDPGPCQCPYCTAKRQLREQGSDIPDALERWQRDDLIRPVRGMSLPGFHVIEFDVHQSIADQLKQFPGMTVLDKPKPEKK